MDKQTEELLKKANKARSLYNRGEITREEAIDQIHPYIIRANSKGEEIAKRFRVSHRNIDVRAFLR